MSTGKPCKHGHLSDRYTYSGFCKKCHSEILVKNQRKYNLKRYYGITKEQYDKMFMEQNGLCKICNKPETTIDGKTKKLKTMSVDHCHDTNKIRGILCNNCNQGLGKFKHNPILLRQAALYCEAV